MRHYSVVGLIALLAPLVFSFAIGQDIFIPVVPKMMDVLHASQSSVQLTLSLFMSAVGFGQLISGPLSDQFGRRRIILWGLFLYIVASLLCAFATTLPLLIAARVLEGFGACGMMVGAFAVVRDLYSGNESARLYSYLNGAIAVSPLLAPLMGGLLDTWFGWRAPFVALGVIGLITAIPTWFLLSETQPPQYRVKADFSIIKRYARIISNKQFFCFAFAASSSLASFFVFFSVSPYVLMTLLHVPEVNFGFYFALVGTVFFIMSLISAKLCLRWGIFPVVILGTSLIAFSGIVGFLWYTFFGLSVVGFVIPACIASSGGACLMGSGAGGALEPFGEIAGSASAVLGAFEFLLSTITGSIVMSWNIQSDLPFAIGNLCLGLTALTLILLWRYGYLLFTPGVHEGDSQCS
jgi:DHA1 family bicyclomycin/chloramphenicol resistance-like MFS transporter